MATINVALESTCQEILNSAGGFSAENDKIYWSDVILSGTKGSVSTDNLILSINGSGELLTAILFLQKQNEYYGSSSSPTYISNRIKLVVDDVIMFNIQAQKSGTYNYNYPEHDNCSIGFSSIADWYNNESHAGFFKGLVYKYGYDYFDKYKPNRNYGSSRLIDFSTSLYTETTKLSSYDDKLANVFIYKEDPIKFNKGFKIYVGYDYNRALHDEVKLYARYKLR